MAPNPIPHQRPTIGSHRDKAELAFLGSPEDLTTFVGLTRITTSNDICRLPPAPELRLHTVTKGPLLPC